LKYSISSLYCFGSLPYSYSIVYCNWYKVYVLVGLSCLLPPTLILEYKYYLVGYTIQYQVPGIPYAEEGKTSLRHQSKRLLVPGTDVREEITSTVVARVHVQYQELVLPVQYHYLMLCWYYITQFSKIILTPLPNPNCQTDNVIVFSNL
jgi:hypothetical protein